MRNAIIILAVFALPGCFDAASRFNSSTGSAYDHLRSATNHLAMGGDANTVKYNCIAAEKDVDRAIVEFGEAEKIYSSNAVSVRNWQSGKPQFYCQAYSMRGRARFGAGKYSEAIGDFDKITKDWDEYAKIDACKSRTESAVLYRGISLHSLKNYNAAIKDYRWVIEFGKNTDNIRLAYENQGLCYYGLRDYLSAKMYFEKYLDRFPDLTAAAVLVCESRFYAWDTGQSKGQPKEQHADILAFCRKTLERDPDNKAVQQVIYDMTHERSVKIDLNKVVDTLMNMSDEERRELNKAVDKHEQKEKGKTP